MIRKVVNVSHIQPWIFVGFCGEHKAQIARFSSLAGHTLAGKLLFHFISLIFRIQSDFKVVACADLDFIHCICEKT